MEKGSLRGSVFTLLSIIIGIGSLSLPLALKNSGLILGLGIIFLNACVGVFGLHNISLMVDAYQIYHYPSLIRKIKGDRIGRVMDIMFIVYYYTSFISNQVILGSLVPSICSSLGIHYDAFLESTIVQLFALVVILIPLGLFRELSELRYVQSLACSASSSL